MTILFNGNIANLMAGAGLLAAFSSPCAISIYGGSRPTAAQITASWSSYNSANANFLAHYIGATWTNPLLGTSIQLTTIPPAVNANNTGTGTWCILWVSNVSAANVASTTLPNTSFIVADVSTSAGSGVIRFTDTSFVSGVSNVILSGSITAVAS